MGFRRQGPFFNLKLDQTFYKKPSVSLDKNETMMKTRLKINRYSIGRPERESKKKITYNTISYEFLNDPDFYGTKGKKDQIESYQVLLH
jgi:hypothetical protein